MLLAPHCQIAVPVNNLSGKNTFHSTVKRFKQPLTIIRCQQIRISIIRSITVHQIADNIHSVDHRIVIIRNMNLITSILRPELRPSAIFILPGQKKIHTTAKSIPVLHIASSFIKPGKICHLYCCGIIVGCGIIAAFFLIKDSCCIFFIKRPRHVDILWPSSCNTLIQ